MGVDWAGSIRGRDRVHSEIGVGETVSVDVRRVRVPVRAGGGIERATRAISVVWGAWVVAGRVRGRMVDGCQGLWKHMMRDVL